MRKTLLACIALPFAASLPALASAQDYPSKMIEIIVPYPPGSSVDSMARVLADKLKDKWGQSVIVDNRAGAAGNIGAVHVARSEPDGYTLLFCPPAPLAINKSLYSKLPYDPDKFVPVSLVTVSPSVLVINPKLPAQNLQEFIAYAKTRPGKITYASSGAGGTTHLASALFASMADVNMVHVPYKGSGAALNDVIAGHVDMMMSEAGILLPFIRSGKVRVLATGNVKRNPVLPDVPALTEILPGYVSVSWQGMAAPEGTPPAIVDKISTAIAEIMKMPDVSGRLKDLSVEGVGSTPAEFEKFLKEERERWAKVIEASGARAD